MQKTARPPLAFGQVWGTGGVSSHEKGERGRRKAEDVRRGRWQRDGENEGRGEG